MNSVNEKLIFVKYNFIKTIKLSINLFFYLIINNNY